MLKTSENPPTIFPVNSLEKSTCGQWRVAHTKSRNEKTLAWMLNRWDIPYFLPLVKKVTRNKQRALTSFLPLFSGYLFFCGDEKSRYKALTSNKIANIIDVVNQDRLVAELMQIHRALESGLPIDPYPNLLAGDRCRVIAGPLMGAEGILLRKKSMTRLLLEVEILGQAAAVEIDMELLEPVA